MKFASKVKRVNLEIYDTLLDLNLKYSVATGTFQAMLEDPDITETQIQKILQQDPYGTVKMVAKHPKTPSNILTELLNHRNTLVVIAVVNNPNYDLHSLSANQLPTRPSNLLEIVASPKCPTHILTHIYQNIKPAENPDRPVRLIVRLGDGLISPGFPIFVG